MPSWGEFERLSADVSKLPWCSSLSDSHFYRDHFILPFFFENKKDKVTTEGLDELCEWTIKNTRHVGITKTEIRELYDKFINWVDNQLLANNPTWRFKRGLDQSSNAADSRRQEILFRKFELK
jgi:predicted DNA-binding protein